MKLYATSGNTVPKGGTTKKLITSDGIYLRAVFFKPDKEIEKEATVLILQGRAECIEMYFDTINILSKKGFRVVAFDWRGQGKSERLLKDPKIGHINDFNDYGTDLKTVTNFATSFCGATKMYALSHSLGSCIAFQPAVIAKQYFERQILIAPLFGILLPAPLFLIKNLIKIACIFNFDTKPINKLSGKGLTLRDNPKARSCYSRSEEKHMRNKFLLSQYPQLALDVPTFQWVNQAIKACNSAVSKHNIAQVKTPTLIITADNDTVVDNKETKKVAHSLKYCNFQTMYNSSHELLNEQEHILSSLWHKIIPFIENNHQNTINTKTEPY